MKNDKEKRATFTPGPWTSEDCTGGGMAGLCFSVKSENTIVARTTDGWKEAKANARLIAAAPELYEQCKLFEKVLSELVVMGEADIRDRDKLRGLLARVDGREA